MTFNYYIIKIIDYRVKSSNEYFAVNVWAQDWALEM